jgi:hypothetical protein
MGRTRWTATDGPHRMGRTWWTAREDSILMDGM